jgi:GPN-loop GTPase
MPFGQIVIGPPGSGKSTFCLGAAEFFRASGRPVCIVNLDPANDDLPYQCDVDLVDLVSLELVQAETSLGPNGSLVYCMQYLDRNFDWLQVRPIHQALCHGRSSGKYLE